MKAKAYIEEWRSPGMHGYGIVHITAKVPLYEWKAWDMTSTFEVDIPEKPKAVSVRIREAMTASWRDREEILEELAKELEQKGQ